MAVRIRMKRLGRRHRPFFRICAMDTRTPRDGRPIEELGIYDPMIRDVDARAILEGERIDYWLGVGASPSEKVAVLIKKYGTGGTHLEKQKAALERLAVIRSKPLVVATTPTEAEEAPTDQPAPEEPVAEGTSEEKASPGEEQQ